MTRDTTLKVLGVTIADTLSASDHVRCVIIDSAQSLYALRLLWHHGHGEAGFQMVFRTIVVSRLTYAASVWVGFINGTVLHRGKRCGYCSPDLPDFVQLMEKVDEQLFRRINNNSRHVLRGMPRRGRLGISFGFKPDQYERCRLRTNIFPGEMLYAYVRK